MTTDASGNGTAVQHPDERHAPWCDLEQHALTAEGDPGRTIGCVGRTIDVGRGSVWLSNNYSDDGTARVVVDRKPADWQTLTSEEMAEFAVGLVQVLAEYGRGQGR